LQNPVILQAIGHKTFIVTFQNLMEGLNGTLSGNTADSFQETSGMIIFPNNIELLKICYFHCFAK